MKRAQTSLIKFNNTTACIVAVCVLPFALCGLSSIFSSQASCLMVVFYWLVTITGLLAAKQIKALGRRYALTVSKEFIIYKEPFTSKLIKFTDVFSIHAAPDNNLVLTTVSMQLVVPRSIIRSNDELARTKKMLERFAPPTCRIDLRSIALETQ